MIPETSGSKLFENSSVSLILERLLTLELKAIQDA